MGIVAVHFDLAVSALLALFILARGTWRQHPYLSAYVAIRLAQDMMQLPILYSQGMGVASETYWTSAPLLTGAMVSVLDEYRRNQFTYAPMWGLGMFLGITQFVIYESVIDPLPTMVIQAIASVIVLGIAIAIFANNRSDLLALGLIGISTASLIQCDYKFAMNSEYLRWIPDFGYLFGLSCWIGFVKLQKCRRVA